MSQITGEAKSVVSTSGALNSFIYLILRKKNSILVTNYQREFLRLPKIMSLVLRDPLRQSS